MVSFEKINNILNRVSLLQEENAKSFKITDEKFKETNEKFKETEQRFKETDERFKENVESFKAFKEENRRILKELSQNLGGIGNSNGDYAEEFFYNTLLKNKKLGHVKYDALEKNVRFSKKGIHDEFDLVMINGDSVALVETKYKANLEHLEKLTTKKPNSFRSLFP